MAPVEVSPEAVAPVKVAWPRAAAGSGPRWCGFCRGERRGGGPVGPHPRIAAAPAEVNPEADSAQVPASSCGERRAAGGGTATMRRVRLGRAGGG
ncbi:hypothetical protein Shyhy02_51170 [Streptomyces hygroscopicus subsp. hygroscopicus]|nr:hypothetical protein Shyhy02_51170 [Streptomyces hygroscopicus subsp. hygroscopicus]